MTEAPLGGAVVPQWTLADRLRKARLHAGLEQAGLAREIGIGRSTIVTYENGKSEPSRPVLLSWALRCGVALEWLAGDTPKPRGGEKLQVSQGFTSRSRRSRPRPGLTVPLLTHRHAA